MADDDRGVYAPPPEDEYDARDSGRRGMLLLAVCVVVMVVAGFMAWSAYNLGVREGGRDAPPRIVAETGPFRTEPADPGGFEAPGQDIEVYDTLTGEPRQTAERIAPPPEEPLPEAMEAPEASEEPEPAPAEGITIVERDAPGDLRPAPEEPASQAPAPQPDPEPAPEPEPEPAAPVQAAASGGWLVQLAALRSQEEAEATWIRVATAHPELMGAVDRDIQRADLGERGVYYRVRAAAFSTKAGADDFCGRLKQAGQDCIVVAR